MRRFEVKRQSAVSTGYRAERARGLFNVEEQDGASFTLEATIPEPEEDWRVGVIVGSSGSGKSTLGQDIAAEWSFREWSGGKWSKTESILEAIAGKHRSFDEVTGVLSAVGLGSVPAWLRPYGVLSNGEKFRADCAKLLLQTLKDGHGERVIIDEFTSVLDRQVAQVGAAAFVRAWRKVEERQLILLTCHHDVLEFVLPDWVFDTDKKRLYTAEEHVPDEDDAARWPEVGKLTIQR